MIDHPIPNYFLLVFWAIAALNKPKATHMFPALRRAPASDEAPPI
jgi:hypothetical protein